MHYTKQVETKITKEGENQAMSVAYNEFMVMHISLDQAEKHLSL